MARSAWRPARPTKGKTGKLERVVVARTMDFKIKGSQPYQQLSVRGISPIGRKVRKTYSAELAKLKRGL